jgi:predicted transcriptional regulator
LLSVLVSREELEKVRESIDLLLEKSRKQVVVGSAEQKEVRNSAYELDEKEKQIVDYLKKNPGSTKEDVVTNLNKYSRVTILRAISRLLEKDAIITTRKSKRSRINHLYVNYKEAIFSLQEYLGAFQYSYSELIDEAITVICSRLFKKGNTMERKISCLGLFHKLVELYKFVCIMYITSDIFLWSRRPLDSDTLHIKFGHFFNTMKRIHYELIEITTRLGIDPERGEEIVCDMLWTSKYGFSKVDLFNLLKYFEKYNLGKDLEPVVDTLWALSYPTLPLIDLSYKEYQEKGKLGDWRDLFKKNDGMYYEPKTEQWFLPE